MPQLVLLVRATTLQVSDGHKHRKCAWRINRRDAISGRNRDNFVAIREMKYQTQRNRKLSNNNAV